MQRSLETRVKLPEIFTPMQRILLTANGNVQRILSAYYNDTVTVRVLKNEARKDSSRVFDRKVEIVCCDKVSFLLIKRDDRMIRYGAWLRVKWVFYLTSLISLLRVGKSELVNSFGMSRSPSSLSLCSHFNVLPEFKLIDMGKTESHFWRKYELYCADMHCLIHETFPNNVLE